MTDKLWVHPVTREPREDDLMLRHYPRCDGDCRVCENDGLAVSKARDLGVLPPELDAVIRG